mgnify:FL=1
MKNKSCQWCDNENATEIETHNYFDSYHQDGGTVSMTTCKDAESCRNRHREKREVYLAQRMKEIEGKLWEKQNTNENKN